MRLKKYRKMMKSKKGFAPALLIPILPWIMGLTLFGVPIFVTWFKLMFTKPASPAISPIWIGVGIFVVLLLLRKR